MNVYKTCWDNFLHNFRVPFDVVWRNWLQNFYRVCLWPLASRAPSKHPTFLIRKCKFIIRKHRKYLPDESFAIDAFMNIKLKAWGSLKCRWPQFKVATIICSVPSTVIWLRKIAWWTKGIYGCSWERKRLKIFASWIFCMSCLHFELYTRTIMESSLCPFCTLCLVNLQSTGVGSAKELPE